MKYIQYICLFICMLILCIFLSRFCNLFWILYPDSPPISQYPLCCRPTRK